MAEPTFNERIEKLRTNYKELGLRLGKIRADLEQFKMKVVEIKEKKKDW